MEISNRTNKKVEEHEENIRSDNEDQQPWLISQSLQASTCFYLNQLLWN